MKYDVAVIGAGVVGSLITRELSKYNIRVALLERCNDCAMGATKANSGIVHAGFDAAEGSLMAKMNVGVIGATGMVGQRFLTLL